MRTRQAIGKHMSITYNMLYWTICIFAVKIVNHSLHQDTTITYAYHVMIYYVDILCTISNIRMFCVHRRLLHIMILQWMPCMKSWMHPSVKTTKMTILSK